MQTLVLSLGAGWASSRTDLPEGLEALTDPLVMFAAGFMYLGFMYLVEFFTD